MTTIMPADLNDRLHEWAQHHAPTLSEEHRAIREAFQAKFPLETLTDLTLDQYALGHGDAENFCYWLEWKTGMLGSISGGAARKFGVYWSQKQQGYAFNAMFSDPEDAKKRILSAIVAGAQRVRAGDFAGVDAATAVMGEARYTMRLKALTLYFPDEFLPICKPEDLQRFLRLFGQVPSGDQAALNRQLLAFLRSQPAAAAFDTVGLMRFLYNGLIPPAPPERQIWKMAVGEGSVYLPEALSQGAIFLGSSAPDLSQFPAATMAENLAAVGDDPGFASSAVHFVHGMHEGDVVIANRGMGVAAAVGIVDGPYLRPGAEFNPMTPEVLGGRFPNWGHARRVRWLLTEELNLPAGLTQFAMKTVSPVAEPTLQGLLNASAARDGSAEHLARLTELGWTGALVPPPVAWSSEVQYLMEVASHTKNIILYGPPGTGKTFTAREFAEAWLEAGSPTVGDVEPLPSPIQPTSWWQAILVALADLGEASVAQIQQHPAVQDFMVHRPANNSVTNTLWLQLLSHTDPADDSSKVTARHRPYVFTKAGTDPSATRWRLTAQGQAEVARLAQTPPPSPTTPPVSLQLITFHPAFTYEEFVEGLRPTQSGGFEVRDGAFKRICQQAHAHPDQNYVLIIDEINRADTAKTFGELMTLLEDDKRSEPGTLGRYAVTLPYSEPPNNQFSVPNNLYLIGTMNTADRSVTLMDVALRRRFTFIEVPPKPELLRGTVAGTALSPEQLLITLNSRLTSALDSDHRIGHAYLMGETLTVRDLAFRWRHKLAPLLQEFFYAQEEQLRVLLGDALYGDALGSARLDDSALMDALMAFAGSGQPAPASS